MTATLHLIPLLTITACPGQGHQAQEAQQGEHGHHVIMSQELLKVCLCLCMLF